MTLHDAGAREVAPPEPDLHPDELVARAAAMRDTLRARQQECEDLGRLPDATFREFTDAGFFRMFQPRRFGGYEFPLEAFHRVAIELSRGCPSSGWVFALTAAHPWIVAQFPEDAQAELFGDGDFCCPLSNLAVPAVPVEGGYRLTGHWDYGSGCDVGSHFIGGILVPGEEGAPPDTRWAAFTSDDYTIVDNWDTHGMRGTGSRRVVVEDLFVPERLVVESPNPFRPIPAFPGRDVHTNPIFRAGTLAPLMISEPAAVAVGIAQGAMDAYIEVLSTKHQYGPASPLRRDVSSLQRTLGQATSLVDTAEATLLQIARQWTDQAHAADASGVRTGDEAERRMIAMEQQVIELSAAAVEIAFRTAGSSAANRGEPIERCFRDINMIRTHVTLQFDRTWENVGALRLGLAPPSFF
jgi:3-hydroxy-9,10-secoandrosta-1,3,5(10)-triene-9,17-dione monooxygenase